MALASFVGTTNAAALPTQWSTDAAEVAGREDLPSPRLPRPFDLPELSHSRLDAGLAWTAGGAEPNLHGRPLSAIGLVRVSIESPIGDSRRVYVGATYPIAAALPPDGSGATKTVFGNGEVFGRVAFPMPSWLATGAVLGIVLPTALYDRGSPAAEAATTAISLEPTNFVQFRPGIFAFRPALDLRILRGPFVLQAREGIDVEVDSRGLHQPASVGRLLIHAGVLTEQSVELSVEATQAYFFTTEFPDSRRTVFTIGPAARLSYRHMDVGAGLVTNLFSPLDRNIDQFVALRLSLMTHL